MGSDGFCGLMEAGEVWSIIELGFMVFSSRGTVDRQRLTDDRWLVTGRADVKLEKKGKCV